MDIDTYRQRVKAIIDGIGHSITSIGYPVIASASLLPLLANQVNDPGGTYSVLVSMLGGFSGNLIANIVQKTYDAAKNEKGEYDLLRLAKIIEQQVHSNTEISPAIAQLVNASGVISEVAQTLKDLPTQWEEFAQHLLEQVKELQGTTVIIEKLNTTNITVITSPTSNSAKALVLEYLRLLFGKTDFLRLGTIDPKFEVDSPIRLSQVYVLPFVENIDSHNSMIRHANPVKIISEAFKKNIYFPGIVLLGGPGSGKSALLDRLTNSLCIELLSILQNEKVENQPSQLAEMGWNAPLIIPVKVSLQEFAAHLASHPVHEETSGTLWEHIGRNLQANALEDFIPILNQILSGVADLEGNASRTRGCGGLILLDGLDEVPMQQRRQIEHIILEFVTRFNRSLVVITCRSYSWNILSQNKAATKEKGSLERFNIYEIMPFSSEQISLFIRRWYTAVRSLKQMSDDAAEHRIATLKAATEMPTLVPLTEKPLLLTLMATLHTSRGHLPNDRATLYAESVSLLLEIWQRAKDLHIGGKTTIEGGLLEEFGISSDAVERVLRQLAYETHLHSMGRKTRKISDDARLTAEQLRKAFRPLVNNSWDQAELIVNYLQRRAGLLEFEGEDIYRFPHRTFQEFLAACYLLDEPNAPFSLIDNFLSHPTWWGEVFSLAVGRQSRTSYGAAVGILSDTFAKISEIKNQQQLADIFSALLNTSRDIALVNRQKDSKTYFNLLHDIIKHFFIYSGWTLDKRIVFERGSIFTDTISVLEPHVLPLLDDVKAGDAAAITIGTYGNKTFTTPLLVLLDNQAASVRARAACALGGTKDIEAVKTLAKLCQGNDETPVILEGIKALGKIGGDEAISVLLKIANNPIAPIRKLALDELSRFGDPKTVKTLASLLEYTDERTAASITHTLASIATPEAIKVLINLLRNSELALVAEEALIEVGQEAVPYLRRIYERAEEYEMIEHIRRILSYLDEPMFWRSDLTRDFTDGKGNWLLADDDW